MAIAAWLFFVVMIGVGSGVGSYCYFKINGVKNAEIASEVVRAVGFAALGGFLGFGVVLGFIAKIGYGSVIRGEEPSAVPKKPWQTAAVVGLLGALGFSALECADRGAPFDWNAFGSSLAGSLPALSIAWMALGGLGGRRLPGNQDRGRDPGP